MEAPRRRQLNARASRYQALSALLIFTLTPVSGHAEDFACVWNDANNTWQSGSWLNCGAVAFPNNGGGLTYDAQIDNGSTVTINSATSDIQIEDLRLTNGSSVSHLSRILEVTGAATIDATSTYTLGNGSTLLGGTWTGTIGSAVSSTTAIIGAPGNEFTLTSGSQINIANNSDLDLSGTVNNDGTITYISGGASGDSLRISSNLLLQGTGNVLLTRSDNFIDGGGSLIQGMGHTIEGLGAINNIVFTNNGLVDANNALGNLSINTIGLGSAASAGLVNNAVLQASGGGTLVISNDRVDNSNGTIQALDTSLVSLLSGARVEGGVLSTFGSGRIQTTISSNVDVEDVTITAGSVVGIGDNSDLNVRGAVINDGTITYVPGGASIDSLEITDNDSDSNTVDLALTGNGRIVLNGNDTRVDGNGRLSHGANHTIEGFGNLGGAALTLENEGLITANVSGQNLLIDTAGTSNSGESVINNGTLQAVNGGTLTIVNDRIDNNNGMIEVLDTSLLSLLNLAEIEGGTLSTSGTGRVQTAISSNIEIDNVNIATGSLIEIGDNSDLNTRGAVVNNGVITFIPGGASLDSIEITDNDANSSTVDLALSGTGRIVLNGNDTRVDGNGRLHHGADHVIEGFGNVGGGVLTVENEGLVTANVGGQTLVIDTAGTGSGVTPGFINSGTVRAENSATLTIGADLIDNTAGVLETLSGGRIFYTNLATVNGGTVNNTVGGIFETAISSNVELRNVNFINDGQVLIADNSDFNVSGTLTNDGTITYVSGGTSADSLEVSNNLILQGTGNVLLTRSDNAIDGGGTLTQAAGHTIEGAGAINNIVFTNNGLVDANDSTGSISINTLGNGADPSAGVINNSVLQASMGGTLVINNDRFDNTNGLIQALDASLVSLLSGSRIEGGTLSTSGSGRFQNAISSNVDIEDVTIATGSLIEIRDNSDLNARGTIVNNGTITYIPGGGNLDSFEITDNDSDPTTVDLFLNGNGRIVLNNSNTRVDGNGRLSHGANHTIEGFGNVGGNGLIVENSGLISANVDGQTLIIDTFGSSASAESLINDGTLQAINGGTLSIVGTPAQNNGVIEALDGSAVTFATSSSLSNNMVGDLVGGTYRAIDGGNGATITLRGDDITTNSADILLSGANSLIQVDMTSIDTTMDTNNGTLRVHDGRIFNATANGGNFTNNGILEVSDGTFAANTLVSDGDINSFGNSVVTTAVGSQITGTGNISSSLGSLELTRGVDMGAGSSLTSNSGANVDLSMAAQASQVDVLNNNGSLDLGSQNILVTQDYTNANFGVGNAFDPRANVSGSGQIIGNSASQTITGDVTNTAANTFSLDLGNVRGGTSTTVDFQVANNGTGADIRGAIQDGANGGNLTDARLSGSGAGASNFGPVTAGADTGNLSVTFDATSGGSLAGQSLAVVSNFDNVATQVINLTGVATTLAQGSATPNSNPVDLGNFRVGGTMPSQDFAVENTSAADPTTERLGISSVGTTGNFSATNVLGGGFIAGGASQAGAVSVAVNGGTAGVNSGSVGIQYATNGELIDAGFTSMNANLENINVQATGFNAAVGSTTPSPTANLGNVRIGGALTQALNVANTAAPGAFSEDLAAVFGANSGDASNNGGSVAGLLAGAANGAAMSASLDASSAGAKSGSVTVNYTTSGEVGGVSNGLGAAAAGSEVVSLTGNVFQTAVGQLNTAPLNFGTVQVGQVVTQALGLENIATGAAGHVEDLNVRFGATSGSSNPGLISGAGSISGLAAGASDNSSLVVTVDTSAAAVVNGQVLVDYFSAGTVNGANIAGLSEISVGSDPFGVQGVIQTGGQVVDQANPSIASTVIALGNVRIGGTSATDFVDVTNVASGNAQAALSATITGNNPVTASGSFSLLNPGASNNSSLQVGLNTAAAGAINGTADIAFVSDASNIGNCAPNCALSLGTQSVTVTGNVFRLATGNAAPNPVDLGNFRLGSGTLSADLAVTNTAAADGSSEQLGIGSVASSNALFTAANNLGATRINAQGNSAGAVTVGLGAGLAAGVNNGSVDIQYLSDGTASGTGAAINSNSESVAVSAAGYRLANPLLNTANVTVAARVGDTLPGPVAVSVSNVSPDMFTEGLNADFAAASAAGFNTMGSVANLAANGTSNSDLMVSLASTSVSQNTAGNVDVNFVSTGAGTTGEADMAVGTATVNLTAKVYEAAVAAVSGTTTVDFGTVRVADTGPSTEMTRQIGNTATGALVDDLQGGFISVAAGFSADAGALTGAGVASGGNTDLTFGIDTSAAGVFSGTANLGLVSHNDDLTDLGLTGETFNLTGTVNNLASPIFDLNSGNATLTGGGNLYNLVFDTVLETDNSFLMADLSVINDVVGPADMLDGFFDISGAGVFSALGFDPINDLVAGAAQSGLMVGFDTSTQGPGAFMASIFLDPTSVFAGLSDVNLQVIELRISGLIRQVGGNVPVPGTLLLFIGPVLFLLYGVKRRRRFA